MNGEIIKSKRCHFDRKSTGDPSTLEICPDLEYSVSSKERSKKKKKEKETDFGLQSPSLQSTNRYGIWGQGCKRSSHLGILASLLPSLPFSY